MKFLFSPSVFSPSVFSQDGVPLFKQDGDGAVTIPVVQILKEWFWLSMFGGGPGKTAAQNATAFRSALAKLRRGGTLHVGAGFHSCDPVVFTMMDGGPSGCMTIEGVGNPGGPGFGSVIVSSNAGTGKFWDFDAPAGPSGGGSLFTLRNLMFHSNNPEFAGTVVSASTPVTDGSRIASNFVFGNSTISQAAGGRATFLDIGRTMISTIDNAKFTGGACQIRGREGPSLQSTTITIRKCTFMACDGYPVLWGGDTWGFYDNIFEPTKDGRIRAFFTDADRAVRNNIWMGNWFGDFPFGGPAEQMIVVHGTGFTFKSNYACGTWAGQGNPCHAIHLNGVKVFDISSNVFEYFSAPILASNSPNVGVIEANGYNIVADQIVSGALQSSVRVQNNGLTY